MEMQSLQPSSSFPSRRHAVSVVYVHTQRDARNGPATGQRAVPLTEESLASQQDSVKQKGVFGKFVFEQISIGKINRW